MAKKRTFISFDYDNDQFLKEALVGQAKNDDSPFDLADHSNKEHLTGDWKEKTRSKIKGCDVVVFMCGENTHKATGVNAELKMAQEEAIPYFMVWGYDGKTCTKPLAAKTTDNIYKWDWNLLKQLFAGDR
jgi:hypothetical protein